MHPFTRSIRISLFLAAALTLVALGARDGRLLNSGAVTVIYGSPPGSTLDHANGLTSLGNQFWTAGSAGIPSIQQQDAHFGSALY